MTVQMYFRPMPKFACAVAGGCDFRLLLVAHVNRGDAVFSDKPADGLAFACSRCGKPRA